MIINPINSNIKIKILEGELALSPMSMSVKLDFKNEETYITDNFHKPTFKGLLLVYMLHYMLT